MWYLAVFVPASEDAAATAVSSLVWPGSPSQMRVALKDALGAPWVGCNAALSDAEIAALQGLAAVPGVRWYRYALDGRRPLGMAWPTGQADPGTPWGWEESLLASGLTLA